MKNNALHVANTMTILGNSLLHTKYKLVQSAKKTMFIAVPLITLVLFLLKSIYFCCRSFTSIKRLVFISEVSILSLYLLKTLALILRSTGFKVESAILSNINPRTYMTPKKTIGEYVDVDMVFIKLMSPHALFTIKCNPNKVSNPIIASSTYKDVVDNLPPPKHYI